MYMKKIAVILAGAGVKDGSELHEAVLSLWALAKNKIEYQCFAPDKQQHHVINHSTGTETKESRNVLIESARIARGNIKALTELNVNDFDAVLFPGGFGAAKNLFTYAFDGANFTIDKEIENIIINFHASKKPIVALCISPLMIAKVLKAKVTLGNDEGIAKMVKDFGAIHETKNVNEICFDEKNLVITTPCYMITNNIYDISLGIEAAIEKLVARE